MLIHLSPTMRKYRDDELALCTLIAVTLFMSVSDISSTYHEQPSKFRFPARPNIRSRKCKIGGSDFMARAISFPTSSLPCYIQKDRFQVDRHTDI